MMKAKAGQGALPERITMFSTGTRVSHSSYGMGTIVEVGQFASGVSYKVRWDNGGPMASGDTSWERPATLTVL